MKKKERRICVVDSLYCLFLYFLICGINETDIFVASERVPLHIRKKLNAIYFPQTDHNFENLSSLSKIKKTLINKSKRIFGTLKLRFLLYFKTRDYHVKAYGQGHLDYSFPIYEYEDGFLLEDGLTNYVYDLKEPSYNEDTLRIKILYFFGCYVLDDSNACLGPHKKIKKVYLTKKDVPDIIKNKTEVIDMKKLWEIKPESEKNKILDIYDIKEIINLLTGKNIILLITQCLSEDGIIPFDEEITIYNRLIKKYKSDKIIIKPHPREKKDYTLIFPKSVIIDKPFPLELLKCVGVKIEKILTVSSNAASSFVNECEIESYNGETSSKKLNKQITSFNEMIYNMKN